MVTGVVVIMAVAVAGAVAGATVDASNRLKRQAPNCGPGKSCTPLRSCRTFKDFFTNPTIGLQRRIRQAACNRNRRDPRVCCLTSEDTSSTPFILSTPPTTPTPPTTNPGEALLPSTCGGLRSDGSDDLGERVFNGDDARVGELPWMAVLGYDSTTSPLWGCGGTLINQQYVLTAAHCVHQTYTRGSTLEVVRLGEHTLGTEMDCDNTTCAPLPQDFTPAEVIIHPDFDTRVTVSDDIAIIRLDRKADLSDYVRPLCLPPAGAGVKVLVGGGLAEVAGWGLDENGGRGDVLQKASLPFINKVTCNPHFNNELLPEQVCFGGGVQDSCRGDSGGPLVVRSSNPLLVGIVSRGKDSRCAVLGIPAVYTHISAYRNWVTQHLRP